MSSKYVQDMSVDGDEPPQRYIIKEILNPSPPLISIPIIDLNLLSSKEELEKLKEALCSWGCFQAIGHGISSSFMDKIGEIGKQFFALPKEEKQKYARAVHEKEGYGSEPIVSDNQVCDWNDRLFLQIFPNHSRKLHLWPTNPSDFREVVDEYSQKVKEISDVLHKAMARSLNLEDDCFLKQYQNQELMRIKFGYYPVCPRPDSILGIKAHSDGSTITILLQDKEVEGLQILKDDQWYRVPIIPHALVVNAGDQMQILSNGIFKSTIHRVSTGSQRDRISVAVFHVPDAEVEIEPVKELIDEKRPQQYRKITNYSAINFECFHSGKVPLETVKLI